jgi:hypothetical protein
VLTVASRRVIFSPLLRCDGQQGWMRRVREKSGGLGLSGIGAGLKLLM